MINIRTVKFRGRTGDTRNLSQLERVEIYSPVNLQSAVITISTIMKQQLNTVAIHFDPGVRNEDVDPVDDGSITVPEIGELKLKIMNQFNSEMVLMKLNLSMYQG